MDWMEEEWRIPVQVARQVRPLVRHAVEVESIRGGCIEALFDGSDAWSIVAVGLTAFISACEIESYLAEPVPFPSLHILSRVLSGARGAFLSPREVGKGNAEGSLNQLTVYYGQTVKSPEAPLWRQMLPSSHKLHREVHGGYRLRRLLQDEWTENEPVFSHAGYRVLRRFPAGTPSPLGLGPLRAPRSLVGLTAAEAAEQLPGTTASFLFEYRKPRLGLTSAERRLLWHALTHDTDTDLTRALNLSLNTIKTTWRRIYDRFESRLPFVIEAAQDSDVATTRGAEKRRRVLAYVQDHLEELRPHSHD
ncbi:MAG: hypothetical protein R3D44_18280 [Hyphomicrobiaceae bacterium]